MGDGGGERDDLDKVFAHCAWEMERGPGPGPGPSIYVPTMPRRQRDTLARVHVQYPPKQSNHMGVIS